MQNSLVESTANARLRAVVSGWVQGVGYRDFVSREAVRHRLKGYVRNSSDGTVEIEAEGRRDELEGFLQELYDGHPIADVSRIDVAWDACRDEFHNWDLRW